MVAVATGKYSVQELKDAAGENVRGQWECVILENGTVTNLPTIPLSMNGMRPNLDAKIAFPGESSREILANLGYSQKQIDELVKTGALEGA